MEEVATTPVSKPGDGHRERLRQRFLEAQDGSVTDEALLELLLSYAIVRRDVQPLAKSLLARFGNLDAVLAAEPAALRKISGIKDATIALLKLTEHLCNTSRNSAATELSTPKTLPPAPDSETAA